MGMSIDCKIIFIKPYLMENFKSVFNYSLQQVNSKIVTVRIYLQVITAIITELSKINYFLNILRNSKVYYKICK